MNNYEISFALEHITIIVDSREQNTEQFKQRVASFPCPTERQKLDFGDYSIKCELPDGSIFSLANKIAVERKMSLDEIEGNFTRGRERFEREFARASSQNGKIIVLIENGNWEKVFNGQYRSRYNPPAFVASLLTFEARFRAPIHFCSSAYAPMLIYNILYYELREALKNAETECRLDKTVSADD